MRPSSSVVHTTCDRYSRLTWWQMPVPGGTSAEILERLLAPAQKAVALAVALELDLDVGGEGLRGAEIVDLHRMVDDQIDRRQRVDLVRVAAEIDHRLPHRREIDHRRHPGQILHQHARRAERDLAVRALVGEPGADRLDVVDRDGAAVFQAHQVFQQHLERERQARDVAEPGRLRRRVEAEIIVELAVDIEGAAGLQGVVAGDAHGGSPLLWRPGGWRPECWRRTILRADPRSRHDCGAPGIPDPVTLRSCQVGRYDAAILHAPGKRIHDLGALDTLGISRRLKDVGFNDAQAEAVTEIIRDARSADLASLATKAEIDQLEAISRRGSRY